eukprot:scaffold27255_cov21-Tisochrysis_lutea.AAC.6
MAEVRQSSSVWSEPKRVAWHCDERGLTKRGRGERACEVCKGCIGCEGQNQQVLRGVSRSSVKD